MDIKICLQTKKYLETTEESILGTSDKYEEIAVEEKKSKQEESLWMKIEKGNTTVHNEQQKWWNIWTKTRTTETKAIDAQATNTKRWAEMNNIHDI